MRTTGLNRVEHRADGVTVIFLPYRGGVKRCLVWTKDYAKIKFVHWTAVYQNHIKSCYAGSHGGILMHRLLLPEAAVVDHRNFNGLDNRTYDANTDTGNIRPGSSVANSRNRHKWRRKTSSRYKGVSWHRRMNQWSVRIVVDGHRRLWVGAFDSEIQAARAYDRVARDAFGSYALLNFGSPNCRRRVR